MGSVQGKESRSGLERGIVQLNNVVSDNKDNITVMTTSNPLPGFTGEKILNNNEVMRGDHSQHNVANDTANNMSEMR